MIKCAWETLCSSNGLPIFSWEYEAPHSSLARSLPQIHHWIEHETKHLVMSMGIPGSNTWRYVYHIVGHILGGYPRT